MFCSNCGSRINKNARFCASCGAAVDRLPSSTSSVPDRALVQAAGGNAVGKAPVKKGVMDFLMIPVAIILILMGIGGTVLVAAGRTVTAQVTGCEQVLFLYDDPSTRDIRRYKLDYQFAINGERYTGSVTRIFENGSHVRSTIPVRYISSCPHLNAEDRIGVVFAGLLMLGSGVLLFLPVFRKKLSR